jgi:hypothetical protein
MLVVQIPHELAMCGGDEPLDPQEQLDEFRCDSEYENSERKYTALKNQASN